MQEKTVKVYKFNELSDQSKETAIIEYIDFEVKYMNENSPFWEIAQEMEKLHTETFLPSEIYNRCKDSIIETIEANDYDFFVDGRKAIGLT